MPGHMKAKRDNLASLLFSADGPYGKYFAALRQNVADDKLKQFTKLEAPAKQLEFLSGLSNVEPEGLCKPFQPMRDKEKALKLKEEGNDFYRQRQYHEAFMYYTKALQHYPVNESEPTDPSNRDYSIIWGNRSAALDGAGLYAAGIHDIDMALKYGYPRELWYKLYKRKGHCAVKMKQYVTAREALEIALKNVGRSDIKKEKDRDNYRMKIRKQMTIFNVTKSLYNVEMYDYHPSVLANGEKQDRGLSKKLNYVEDGGHKALVAKENIRPDDVLIALDPYVVIVNESGGRAGGKICPQTIEKMFHPIPCSFGSDASFSTTEARDEANKSYHKYEHKILHNLREAKVLERARLALRMVTSVPPEDLVKVEAKAKTKLPITSSPSDFVNQAAMAFSIPIGDSLSEDDKLAVAVMAFFLVRNLQLSGYIRSPSKDKKKFNQEEIDVFNMLCKAVKICLQHARPVRLMEVPKEKKALLDADVKSDVCAYALYPNLHVFEEASTGTERHAIRWFVEKKMVFTAFRQIEEGKPVCIRLTTDTDFEDADTTKTTCWEPEVLNQGKEKAQPNDMITFRCANELCTNSFPLKENTKEKIISCPLEECGLKTNIWERLKQIQKLKKDFADAKEEFKKGDITIAKEVVQDTIDEWDRMIIRPYKEVDQLQRLLIKCMLCEIGDKEREMIEGNQMGKIMSNKRINIMPTEEEAKKETEETALVAKS